MVPLEKIPLIDKPFKRVAINLVGHISPLIEDGHRYILTLVDFATRYPEAVPLKNIDAETVVEVLVDIFSRLGVPEEILSDLGMQFESECMKEVARLLSIKQLTTTPYHPMCNGSESTAMDLSLTNYEEADEIIDGLGRILPRFYPQLRSFGCPAVRSHA